MEAVEFAVKYDYGRDPKGLHEADLVLIGVSRTSKTPLSMYMATKALKVVNVPLVPEIQPMRELYQIGASKIVGLRVDPLILQRIRTARLKNLGLDADASYASLERIKYELDFADKVMERLQCVTIDVSDRAVE
jgi:regulator of PEP synthase PpsR (kinase-PPPase family)